MFNPAQLTFNGEEIKAISEAIFHDGFENPAIDKFHKIFTKIVAKKQIAIMGRLNGLIGKGSTACNIVASNNTFTTTEKFWEPARVTHRLQLCSDDYENSMIAYEMKTGIDRADMTTTDLMLFCQELVEEALKELVLRLAWFGDVNADTIANAGLLTNGTDPDYFNKINGFFVQFDAIALATPARLTTGIDTKNSQLTYALQNFNATDTSNLVVTNTLQNMRYGADIRLRNKTNLIYIVTQSVFDQYERELSFSNSAYTTERLENGLQMLKSGGIEVIAFNFLDRIIESYYNDGSKWHLPHRIVLSSTDNLAIGMGGDLNSLITDVFYSKDLKVNNIDVDLQIDSKVLIDHEVQLAW